MTINFPKINQNQLFSPAILIFILIGVYYIGGLYFKETFLQYSYILAIAGLISSIKVFVTSFAHLEKYIQNGKWLSITVDLVLIVIQLLSVTYGLNFLTQFSYPRTPIGFFLIASIAFCLQVFLSRRSLQFKIASFSVIIYGLLFGTLRLLETYTPKSNELFLEIQVFCCYLVAITEIVNFVISIKEFVKK